MDEGRKKILVVEDSRVMRNQLRQLLDNSYEVRCAEDGLQALVTINQWLPDLIIADIIMPELDGVKLTMALKNRPETKRIPVIFLTSKSDAQSVTEGLRTGARFYLTKPFSNDVLLEKVNRVLEGHHRLD